MKTSTTFSRKYTPFHDNNCDPEDRSSHLYHSQEDNISELLRKDYIAVDGKSLIARNDSLTCVGIESPSRTQLGKEDYEVRVFVETEAESNPIHPKELTDLLEEKGFKKRTQI